RPPTSTLFPYTTLFRSGTDHGHGNVMWVMGGAVAGGKVYGDWQGVGDAALNEGRDLPVTTDFRSVLAQVAERHLKLSDRQLAQIDRKSTRLNSIHEWIS